jgi:hypothetical protein
MFSSCSFMTPPASFGLMSKLRFERPVVFPPGRPRLATNPLPTGSLEVGIMMGIVVVAFCAALMTGVPDATMTSTLRLINSVASKASRPLQETNAPSVLLRNRAVPPQQGDPHAQQHSAPVYHSITSSANASSVEGTLRPSVLATVILIESTYFVGAWTGRLPGGSPRRIRSMYETGCLIMTSKA